PAAWLCIKLTAAIAEAERGPLADGESEATFDRMGCCSPANCHSHYSTLDPLRRNPPCAVSHSDVGDGRELRISEPRAARAPVSGDCGRARWCLSRPHRSDICPVASAAIRRLQRVRGRRERRLWAL